MFILAPTEKKSTNASIIKDVTDISVLSIVLG